MMGCTVFRLVAELRLSVVRGVKVTEEPSLSHAIELHKITHNMGTDLIVRNTPLSHPTDCGLQPFPIRSEDHIATFLCGCIATFQPVTVSSFLWRHRRTNAFHDGLKPATRTVLNTFR